MSDTKFACDSLPSAARFARLKGYLPNQFKVDEHNVKFRYKSNVISSSHKFSDKELVTAASIKTPLIIELVVDPDYKPAPSVATFYSYFSSKFFGKLSENFDPAADDSPDDESASDKTSEKSLNYINATVVLSSPIKNWRDRVNQQVQLLQSLPKRSEINTCAEFHDQNSNQLYTIPLPCKNDNSWFRTYIDKKFRADMNQKAGLPSTSNIFMASLAINLENASQVTKETGPSMVFDQQIFCPHGKIDEILGSQTLTAHEDNENISTGVLQGQYRYMHYRPKDDNDAGWGCAYRSLQTIASWFSHNTRPDIQNPPTFHQIQSALVETGDKKSNFLGSRNWIGSFEVSTVLNQLYEIESKIVHVRSGADMMGQARFLINHFKTGGAPIMIGGGVLAHTIIGCQLDQLSGDVKFLILDPHYTGSDQKLDEIIKKGWVGWKGLDFWKESAFYNMCVPVGL